MFSRSRRFSLMFHLQTTLTRKTLSTHSNNSDNRQDSKGLEFFVPFGGITTWYSNLEIHIVPGKYAKNFMECQPHPRSTKMLGTKRSTSSTLSFVSTCGFPTTSPKPVENPRMIVYTSQKHHVREERNNGNRNCTSFYSIHNLALPLLRPLDCCSFLMLPRGSSLNL